MSLKDKRSVFESASQFVSADPSSIRPVGDRILCRDLGDEEKIGSIFVPDSVKIGAGKNGLIRWGVVVAVGAGDRWIDLGWKTDAEGPSLRAVTTPSGRIPCECKIGDKVLIDHRAEAQIFIDGVPHYLCHEEQSVLAIAE